MCQVPWRRDFFMWLTNQTGELPFELREQRTEHVQYDWVSRSCDLYLLSNNDPIARPLPNLNYLQLRYAAQTILAAQKAAG